MRIKSVEVKDIGGVPEGRIALDNTPVVAFAGANGTGKSRLLACLLAPWTGRIPGSGGDESATVRLELELSPAEQEAFFKLANEASADSSMEDEIVPRDVVIVATHRPNLGVQIVSEPLHIGLLNGFRNPTFLERNKTVDVVHLPAERRLVEKPMQGVDLSELNETLRYQRIIESRFSVQNHRHLDDQEFEQFATALCVSSYLPRDSDTNEIPARLSWPTFKSTVDSLIEPKELLPLTRQHPDTLRVQTADGLTHSVSELSSGERQALIIISRVLRHGGPGSIVIIDEPDAYLHPHLSGKLVRAIQDGVTSEGQLILATHSPSVLDSLSPESIIRLDHHREARPLLDEDGRLALYRSNGFRASALTQSDLLVVTEGESDEQILRLLVPALSRATIRSAGGKAQVIEAVQHLSPFTLPILGVVDRDVELDDKTLADEIHVWPKADLEGLFLSDPQAVQCMLDTGLLKPELSTLADVQAFLLGLATSFRENTIADIAQRALRQKAGVQWPSPRASGALAQLRSAARQAVRPSSDEVEEAIAFAEEAWEREVAICPFNVVRGKYVLNTFASRASKMKTGFDLIEQVARRGPRLEAVDVFAQRVDRALSG